MYSNLLADIEELKQALDFSERLVKALQEGKDMDTCLAHYAKGIDPKSELVSDCLTGIIKHIDKACIKALDTTTDKLLEGE